MTCPDSRKRKGPCKTASAPITPSAGTDQQPAGGRVVHSEPVSSRAAGVNVVHFAVSPTRGSACDQHLAGDHPRLVAKKFTDPGAAVLQQVSTAARTDLKVHALPRLKMR